MKVILKFCLKRIFFKFLYVGQNESEINDVFNFENIDSERIWLVNILQEDGLDGEVDCKTLLSLQHSRKKLSMSKEVCYFYF